MMDTRGWFERLLDTVADHGRELIALRDRAEANAPSDSELCHRLVEGMGEASNIALAREILQRWQEMDEPARLTFLNMLAVEFDPDSDEIARVAHSYRPRDPDSLRRLLEVSEPPRQELFRRLNMAPGGTAVLVAIRAWLLKQLKTHPELASVDADFKHLLTSWFNRGFLSLERIDWNTAASVLEKLIRYEVVHPMNGWDDLRRRLGRDRRCFAFFHPALPRDPLIFVEVALTNSTSAAIQPLIDPESPETDPLQANTAVFYSINNALSGLRGVSFGNFLIKQVVTELSTEFPGIKTFVTLSPIPQMRSSLLNLLEQDADSDNARKLSSVIAERLALLCGEQQQSNPLHALHELIQQDLDQDQQAMLDDVLQDMALFYLTQLKHGAYAYEPVAHFHLSNGARLDRINLHANPLQRGLNESWGCMVNYRYIASDLVVNHEAYVAEGRIPLSRDVEKRHKQLLAKLEQHAADTR